ncbi:replication-relaxation family protein [Streptomyces sp. F001]|uniref:replication-relaxation family protein n=1 Tax=Streptomyces sp. F001 TaxID=1510026 RepID=UPI001F0F27EF|nr:replication-relaxation family protein [Streptomyces sp. F001]
MVPCAPSLQGAAAAAGQAGALLDECAQYRDADACRGQTSEDGSGHGAAAQAAVDALDGIGTLTSYATEVALPVKGTWKNPAIGSARADVVLTAPEAGVPVLFIEVDNCTEEAVLIARKFDKYARFFQGKEKDTDGIEKPLWRTRWSAPPSEKYERVHPPVLLVFHQVGKRSAKNQMARVADLIRHHWQGIWHREESFHSYDGCIPIVATTLELLREHGPSGHAFWRFGRDHHEPLLDAIGNSRRDAYLARRRQAAREEERRRAERMAAERAARRPVCKDCGQKFTDARWEAIGYTRDWSKRQSHPHLCEDCQDRAVAAEQQAEADERERQEQERLRQEAEEQAAAQEAGGWLSHFRASRGDRPRGQAQGVPGQARVVGGGCKAWSDERR